MSNSNVDLVFRPEFSLWNWYTMAWTPSYLQYFYRYEMDCYSNNAVKKMVWVKKDRFMITSLFYGALLFPGIIFVLLFASLFVWTVFGIHLVFVSQPRRTSLLAAWRYRRSVEDSLQDRFVPTNS